jgi:hypothetical protein
MRTPQLFALAAALTTALPGLALADYTLAPVQTVVVTCGDGEAWFANACRDSTWVDRTFGSVDAASGQREATATPTLRLLEGDSITWLSSVQVGARASSRLPEMESFFPDGSNTTRPDGEPELVSTAPAPSDLPPLAVRVPSVDPDAIRGGFLVERRVTTNVQQVRGGWQATLVEERLDLMALGGPQMTVFQEFEFDPTQLIPICEEGAPCVLAYAVSDCFELAVAMAEAQGVYARSLFTGSASEIQAARDGATAAVAAYWDCLGI